MSGGPVLVADQGWLPGPPSDQHEAGRSAGDPVHWPLEPAPLPPSVGAFGLARAAAGVTSTAVTNTAAMAARISVAPLVARAGLRVARRRPVGLRPGALAGLTSAVARA